MTPNWPTDLRPANGRYKIMMEATESAVRSISGRPVYPVWINIVMVKGEDMWDYSKKGF